MMADTKRDDTSLDKENKEGKEIISFGIKISNIQIVFIGVSKCVVLASVLASLNSLLKSSKAVKQTSSGKSPGVDGIPAEIFKHGGDCMKRKLAHLFRLIWIKGSVPQELKRPINITPIQAQR